MGSLRGASRSELGDSSLDSYLLITLPDDGAEDDGDVGQCPHDG
jgi:hypothetical protein